MINPDKRLSALQAYSEFSKLIESNTSVFFIIYFYFVKIIKIKLGQLYEKWN